MKRILSILFVWCSATFLAQGVGLILIHDSDFWGRPPSDIVFPPPTRPRPPTPAWAPLEVNSVKVTTRIRDQLATTSLEEEFYNPNSRPLEGTFLFPVPKGAQLNKFTMEINGQPVAAELIQADKARGLYEEIVRKLRDPALLEYAGRDLFKVRIFPIEANAKKRITLAYSQLLSSDAGLVSYRLPLNTEKFSARPLKNVSIRVDLDSSSSLKSVYSPSHTVEVRRENPHRATIGYEAAEVKPESDFQLYFSRENTEIGANLLVQKRAEEDGFFVLLAAPGNDGSSAKAMPKDVTFVLDTSGSMAGPKLEQAKKALLFCVENLNDEDRFEILRFATDVEPLFNQLAPARAENRGRARTFIKDLKPLGGTAIDDALQQALRLCPEKKDHPYVIIFLTDGKPTVGVTDEDQIVSHVSRGNRDSTRVFCFGIGTDLNTHLLDKITEQTRAFSQYVLPEEDIEVKVSSFFSKIKEPILANPKLIFPEDIHVTKVYPTALPDLFKGEQLVVAGRYSGAGQGPLVLEGTVNGEVKRFTFQVRFPKEAADHDFIPRLWASRRVGYLLDEIRLHSDQQELKEEVMELARKFNIVTPYTAYLILEDEQHRGVASSARTLPAYDTSLAAEASANYRSLRQEKSGSLGLSVAQSAQRLKSADTADAIARSRYESLSGLQSIVPTAPAAPGGFSSTLPTASPMERRHVAAKEREDAYARQSVYVSGRTFYLNERRWVDAQVQAASPGKAVRVTFASEEYFQLLRAHPEVQPWLALGPNIQFVLGTTVYEVHE